MDAFDDELGAKRRRRFNTAFKELALVPDDIAKLMFSWGDDRSRGEIAAEIRAVANRTVYPSNALCSHMTKLNREFQRTKLEPKLTWTHQKPHDSDHEFHSAQVKNVEVRIIRNQVSPSKWQIVVKLEDGHKSEFSHGYTDPELLKVRAALFVNWTIEQRLVDGSNNEQRSF